MNIPELDTTRYNLSPLHALSRCLSSEPQTLDEIRRRLEKRYPAHHAFTKSTRGGMPNERLRFLMGEAIQRGLAERGPGISFVMSRHCDVWLNDFWRREVLEPYLQGILRHHGLSVAEQAASKLGQEGLRALRSVKLNG